MEGGDRLPPHEGLHGTVRYDLGDDLLGVRIHGIGDVSGAAKVPGDQRVLCVLVLGLHRLLVVHFGILRVGCEEAKSGQSQSGRKSQGKEKVK